MNASRNGHSIGEPDAEGFYLGAVRIAHRALRTMIEQAALRTPGVVGIARTPRSLTLGRPIPWQGIGIAVRDQQVTIDLYLLAQRGAALAQVGLRAQEAVAAAVEGLLGVRVQEINVYIQDVV
ncbi:MAG TPA: Asp23/Gls24 family envelope stress response protein [Ktedonobacterales bacterium]